MSSARFYREVTVEKAASAPGYYVLLDGKRLNTPARIALMLPVAALAEALADEWRGQGEKIRRQSMFLTRLAQTAIDRIPTERTKFIEQILAFAGSDLLCYRAHAPAELAAHQAALWDPLLEWVKMRHGAALETTGGVNFIAQSPAALVKMRQAISSYGDFALAGLHSTATNTGSAVIAMALAEERIDAGQAFAAAALDELHQAERWGTDAEAEATREKKRRELVTLAKFFQLLKNQPEFA